MSNEQLTDIFADLVDIQNMQSMDELLGVDLNTNKGLQEGKLITGVISNKRDNGILVDINYKSEGFISKEELPNWAEVAVGDKIEVLLEQLENEYDNHSPILSLQKAMMLKSWNEVVNKHGEGSLVTGKVMRRVKGGLIVDVCGVESFLPGSQIDLSPVKNMDDFIGKDLELKILKVNEERKNIVVSRREILEEARREQRNLLINDIEIKQIRTGIVKNITDFGAFIDLDGIDGLLHITDMSWGRVSHPSEIVSVGDSIEVMIMDIDHEKQRVSLGLKQKTADPWLDINEKYPVGSKVKGRVVNVMLYGVFLEIEKGIEGLIHVSEMSWTKRVTKPSEILNVGDEIEAVVMDIQKDTKKISLGLRQTMENPWEVIERDFPVGTKIKAQVRNMTSYGAFLEIQDGIDGMIHISDMSWTKRINHPGEVFQKGEEVEAIILEISSEQQRISLGLKQLTEDPWSNIEESFKEGSTVKGTVSKITNFGAFVQLDNKIEGLIHISQLSDEHVEKVKDVLNVGDEIEARIIKIDQEERRIGLTLKKEKKIEEVIPVNIEPSKLKPGENMVDFGDAIETALEEKQKKDDEKAVSDSKNES